MKLTATTCLLFFLFVNYSCKEVKDAEDYTGYTDKSFDIAAISDSSKPAERMASIQIKIPAKLDTFYQWQRLSDCASCGKMEYRFAASNYTQFAESGAAWTTIPDSVFQLTFIHDPIVNPRSKPLEPLKAEDTAYLPNYLANQSTWCDTFTVLYKKFQVIHNRPFIITAFTTNCSIITHNKPTLLVGAITSLRNTSLLVLAETNASDTTGFDRLVQKTINSVEISE